MPKQIIRPAGLRDASASRAYSHGVRGGNLLFLAGQTGHDAAAEPGVGRFEARTRRAFGRMQLILEAAGGSLDDLVTMTVFVTDIRYGDEFVRLRGEILQRDFTDAVRIPPGRAQVRHNGTSDVSASTLRDSNRASDTLRLRPCFTASRLRI